MNNLGARLAKAEKALEFFASNLGHKVDCQKSDCFACHARRFAAKSLAEIREEPDGKSVPEKRNSTEKKRGKGRGRQKTKACKEKYEKKKALDDSV